MRRKELEAPKTAVIRKHSYIPLAEKRERCVIVGDSDSPFAAVLLVPNPKLAHPALEFAVEPSLDTT